MAATPLTPITDAVRYPTDATAIVWTAADDGNGNTYRASGRELLCMQNTDALNPQTVTIPQTRDRYGRPAVDGDDDLVITLPADQIGDNLFSFLFLATDGWADGDGLVTLTASDPAVNLAVIQLPR